MGTPIGSRPLRVAKLSGGLLALAIACTTLGTPPGLTAAAPPPATPVPGFLTRVNPADLAGEPPPVEPVDPAIPEELLGMVLFLSPIFEDISAECNHGCQTYALDPDTGDVFELALDWVHPLAEELDRFSANRQYQLSVRDAWNFYDNGHQGCWAPASEPWWDDLLLDDLFWDDDAGASGNRTAAASGLPAGRGAGDEDPEPGDDALPPEEEPEPPAYSDPDPCPWQWDAYFICYTDNALGVSLPVTWLDGSAAWDPVWSPAADVIAFVSTEGCNEDIYVTGKDRWPATRLTRGGEAWDKHPSWSPDGKELVFMSNRTGREQLWVMAADGSNQRLLLDWPLPARRPVWVKYLQR